MLSQSRMLTGLSIIIVLAVVLLSTSSSTIAQTTPEPQGTAAAPVAIQTPTTAIVTSIPATTASPSMSIPTANQDAVDNRVPSAAATTTASPALPSTAASPSSATEVIPSPCKRNISANVVALSQPYMLNRLGAAMPNAQIFALESDVDMQQLQLKGYRRPRPLVLRANVGDCLQLKLKNVVYQYPPLQSPGNSPFPVLGTPQVSMHVQGMNLVDAITSDGSLVGTNSSSLANSPQCKDPANPSNLIPCVNTPGQTPPTPAKTGETKTYQLYAQAEGSFLLYSLGDANTTGQSIDYLMINQIAAGLIGSVNVQPQGAEWYRSQVTSADLKLATYKANQLPPGVTLDCPATTIVPAECKLKIVAGGVTTIATVKKMADGYLYSVDNHPVINYDAVYPDNSSRSDGSKIPSRTPILKMLDAGNNLIYSDLTALITGPAHGRFPGTTGVDKPEPPCILAEDPNNTVKVDPLFCTNPTLPDRKQPYREITVMYHEVSNASQAFPVFTDLQWAPTTGAGMDAFAINYGTGGIGAEIYANRIGVGPMAKCVDCKYEEFFLSSWTVGDPATIVDVPANFTPPAPPSPCNPQTIANGTCTSPSVTKDPPKGPKATMVYYPDDPSNIYHSYMNDHVKFRILHGGNGVTHVHHQHASQWLQSPNSDKSTYLDSQIISPGASYSLEMVYNGSGNLNKTAGDSLFHCHFYPHFAAGMWGAWRVHDVFEAGTVLENGKVSTSGWNRALPDGEIASGVPIPALVPLPTLAMAPIPARVKVCPVDSSYNPAKLVGNDCPALSGSGGTIGYAALVNQDDLNKGMYPGYPFFIPAIAGTRAPHPPLDFAPELDAQGNPLPNKYLDGGLPRHLVIGGTVINEVHSKYDWSKDFFINCKEGQNNTFIAACKNQQNKMLGYLNAIQLPEQGTTVEQAAMRFNGTRNQPSYTPAGQPGFFLTNGLPRKPANYPAQNQFGSQLGAPFADPGIDLHGNVAGGKVPRRYKAAVFQLDVTFNRNPANPPSANPTGWHFPQQRILSLWEDVIPTSNYVTDPTNTNIPRRAPEPLFFRANSGEVVEVWHTNLVPNYYKADDFQVRTPTDILGQHVHLVKFDVQGSDGAANGYNYEDGTFSPTEVQEIVHAINNTGGTWNGLPNPGLTLKPPPSGIIDCSKAENKDRCHVWAGAQTTVQRWYADPVLDDSGYDRTLGTVFTHDHYGPSTHQQAGLYAGFLVEPSDATWRNSETGKTMGGANVAPLRSDGGPTSWKADILTGTNDANSFREFALEFQDFQLAYSRNVGGTGPVISSPDPAIGYRNIDPANRVATPGTPQLISSGQTVGTFSLNYRNEPVPWRAGQFADLSSAFDSTLKQAPTLAANGDPVTPLLRTYQSDPVQVRLLVGAHQLAHFFNIRGVNWLSEPFWSNSGYRSSQAMGLSEHTEMRFMAPLASTQTVNPCPDTPGAKCNFADHLYVASAGDNGVTNGMWGLLRAYSPTAVATNLQPLPNNPVAATNPTNYATCPANHPATKIKSFDITAIDAEHGLAEKAIVLNSRGQGTGTPNTQLTNPLGLMYVFTADLANGQLKKGVPREPLILRAAAGDCINVTLRNGISSSAQVLQQKYTLQAPFDQPAVVNDPQTVLQLKPSQKVGLQPQLLAYDATTSSGINVGYNTSNNQVATIGGAPVQYQWYAGNIKRDQSGALSYTPIEFGSLNLMPSDPLLQHINGLYGSMVIEPAEVDTNTITCDGLDAYGNPTQMSCGPLADPKTKLLSRAAANVNVPNGKPFREFVVMMTEDLKVGNPGSQRTIGAINYKSEPTYYRFGNANADTFAANGDNHCSLSQGLVNADPQTPIFTAKKGSQVRFRMLHPPGTGIVQVFSLHGHVWQRNPYAVGSTQIGDNKLSQWMGSLDNLGATAHYDIVIDKAGGPAQVAGDYLYSAFVPAKVQFGLWGIFRVVGTDGLPAAAGQPVCVQATPGAPAPARPVPPPGKLRLDDFRIRPATKDKVTNP